MDNFETFTNVPHCYCLGALQICTLASACRLRYRSQAMYIGGTRQSVERIWACWYQATTPRLSRYREINNNRAGLKE